MKIKGVIFDLDGTLVDSLQDLTDSVNYALNSQHIPLLSLEEVRQRIGYGIDRLIIDCLPEKYKNNNKVIAQTLELMAKKYSVSWQKNTKLFPDIDKLLDELMIKKVPMAIISNKPEHFVHLVVDLLMKKWDFVACIGGKANIPLKPNPQTTIEVVKKMNLTVEEVCFVGDGDTDIKTAIAAAVVPVAVSWGFRSVSELVSVGATDFIDTPLDLLNYIK